MIRQLCSLCLELASNSTCGPMFVSELCIAELIHLIVTVSKG